MFQFLHCDSIVILFFVNMKPVFGWKLNALDVFFFMCHCLAV